MRSIAKVDFRFSIDDAQVCRWIIDGVRHGLMFGNAKDHGKHGFESFALLYATILS